MAKNDAHKTGDGGRMTFEVRRITSCRRLVRAAQTRLRTTRRIDEPRGALGTHISNAKCMRAVSEGREGATAGGGVPAAALRVSGG
eukprot:4169421-Pleurochrysis_carterae.AAC.1